MKYSFLIPYYKRPELRFTLDSFCDIYSYRNDYEVIIIEDSKNYKDSNKHEELISIINKYLPKIDIKLILDPKESFNPSSKYNAGYRASNGSILILTSPEIPHIVDILGAIDKEKMDNLYIICSCKAVHLVKNDEIFKNCKFSFYMWYQHTRHRDVRYHFCTVLLKDSYKKIGGFNEDFCAGIAYDDDNFVKRVQKAGLIMLPRDDLVTLHIEHSRNYEISSNEFDNLVKVNRNIWASQLSTGNF